MAQNLTPKNLTLHTIYDIFPSVRITKIEGSKMSKKENCGKWYLVYTTHSDIERPGYRTYAKKEVLLKATTEHRALSEAQKEWCFVKKYQHYTPNLEPYLIYKICLPKK
jgi:hypothetical protein